MLSRKVHWARYTYGRTVRTLIEEGLTPEQIVDALAREAGLKEFICDLMDYASNDDTPTDLNDELTATEVLNHD